MSRSSPEPARVDDQDASPDLRALFDAAGDRNALVARCGWRNIHKGRRRLQALVDGDLRLYENFRECLARALNVDVAVVDAAADVERGRQAAIAAREFVPHVLWRTEHSRPTSITMAIISGMVGRLRYRTASDHPLHMLAEAIANCPAQIPFFGRVTGFVINYRYDLSIAFDRQGRPLREQPRSIQSGQGAGFAARLGDVVMPR